jgi:hypothetical protein
MPSYLPQLIEQPGDEFGGASGTKKEFSVRFLGKTDNADFPFTIANEVVATAIGQIIGLHLPNILTYELGGVPHLFVHLLDKDPSMSKPTPPPATSQKIKEWVESHPLEVHGALVLDLFLANNDRAFGPERRNLFLDPRGNLVLYDNSNGCFYRNRVGAGISAGIPRLDAVEADLNAMFDMAHKHNTYFQYLRDWTLFDHWFQRLQGLPEFIIETVVARIPANVARPTSAERERLARFLIARREYLPDHVDANREKRFPDLPKRGKHA